MFQLVPIWCSNQKESGILHMNNINALVEHRLSIRTTFTDPSSVEVLVVLIKDNEQRLASPANKKFSDNKLKCKDTTICLFEEVKAPRSACSYSPR